MQITADFHKMPKNIYREIVFRLHMNGVYLRRGRSSNGKSFKVPNLFLFSINMKLLLFVV